MNNFQNLFKKEKRSKYRNKKVVIDGIKFDSIREGKRYKELILLEKAKKISDLKLQQVFELKVDGILICKYRADFTYWEEPENIYTSEGRRVCEDVKGFKTAIYRLKKKLMMAVHGIEIRET